MKRGTWILIGGLTLAGSVALYLSLRNFPPVSGWSQAVVLLLAVALHLMRVDFFAYPSEQPGSVAATEARSLTAGLAGTFLVLAYYGVEVAVVAALLQSLVSAVVHRHVWFKIPFNTGLYLTATYVGGTLYEVLGGRASDWEPTTILASTTAVVFPFLLQNACINLAISLSTGRSFRKVWSEGFGWTALLQISIGMFGLLLGRFMEMGMTAAGVVLLGTPLALLRYSYKSFADRIQAYVHRMEQANRELAGLNEELRTTNDELIQTLGSLLDARDRYTYGHSAQVARYAVAIGEKMGLSEEELDSLRQAALLHDIGKVGIPEYILFKPGRLDEQEWRIMQAHAEIGYRITRQIHSLTHVAEIIRQHHEWYGGGGYPRNLKGAEILLPARIIAVADTLDTIISDRPYRKGKPVEVAFQEIRRCAGTQFDPRVVAALEQLLKERGGLWFENSAYLVAHCAVAMEVAASMAPVAAERQEKGDG